MSETEKAYAGEHVRSVREFRVPGSSVTQLPSVPSTSRARVAIYDKRASAPRIEDIQAQDPAQFIDTASSRIYEAAHMMGGTIPYTVIRELVENFIHADFSEPIVSVLDNGSTIRFTDSGCGIPDKSKAVMPGYTSATREMHEYIRGVGSGLALVTEFLSEAGGAMTIDDNVVQGTVVTISVAPEQPALPIENPRRQPSFARETPLSGELSLSSRPASLFDDERSVKNRPRLSARQQRVLALVFESGSAGPSLVSSELGIGLSTAYRDLAAIEDMGLISSIAGKRTPTDQGIDFVRHSARVEHEERI